MQIRKDELNILLFLNAYFDRINCQLSIVLRQGQNISSISDPPPPPPSSALQQVVFVPSESLKFQMSHHLLQTARHQQH